MMPRLATAWQAMATVAGLALAAATPAQATVQFIPPSEYHPSSLFGGINVQSLGLSFGGEAGRFVLTGEDSSTLAVSTFKSFCIDVTTSFFGYSPYNIVTSTAALPDAAQRARLAALLAYGNPLIDNAATPTQASQIATALALSVWEVVYDTNETAYDVGSGNFYASGDFTPLIAQSNGYLANVMDGTWAADVNRLRVLESVTGESQNQIFLAGSVPEPTVWAMLILGFGVIGGALRRRRRAAMGAAI